MSSFSFVASESARSSPETGPFQLWVVTRTKL
jgi:hypothetical protein